MIQEDDSAVAAKLWAASKGIQAKRQALGDRALRATSAVAKVFWMRAEAQLVSDSVAHLSPCHDGCSHCCHIAVTLARPEAEVIAREIGRKLAVPGPGRFIPAGEIGAGFRKWELDEYSGVPCTFLEGNRCSIYEHRPLACRTHISVDKTPDPCRMDAPEDSKVRYVNVKDEQKLYVYALEHDLTMADIRDWFPKGP